MAPMHPVPRLRLEVLSDGLADRLLESCQLGRNKLHLHEGVFKLVLFVFGFLRQMNTFCSTKEANVGLLHTLDANHEVCRRGVAEASLPPPSTAVSTSFCSA